MILLEIAKKTWVMWSTVLPTHWCTNTVGSGVNKASNLCEVAVALRDELYGGGLHEERVVRGEHTVNAFLDVLHHHRMLSTAHELPHLIVCGDLCFLQEHIQHSHENQRNQISMHLKTPL